MKTIRISLFAAAFASVAGSMVSAGRASANEICFEGSTYQLGESRVFMGRREDDRGPDYGAPEFDEYLGVSAGDGDLDADATDAAIDNWFSANAAATWGSEDNAQRFAVALAGEYPSQYNFKKIPYSHDGGSAGQLNFSLPNGLDASLGYTKNYKGDNYVTSSSPGICTIGGKGVKRLLKPVEDGHVLPIFTGGTLLVDRNGETSQDFEVQYADGNTIDNSGYSVEFSGVLSGPGGMIYKGAGTTTLTGENTYDGETQIDQGVLQVGDGGVAGSLSASSNIFIQDQGSLWFNRSDDIEIENRIRGGGLIRKLGEGALSLQTASPGFEGKIAVDSGTLEFAGSILGKELEFYKDGVTPTLSIAEGAKAVALGGKNYVSQLAGDGELELGELEPGKSASFVIQSASVSSRFDGKIFGEGDLILSGSDADLTLSSDNALEGKIVVMQPQRNVTPKQIILSGSGTLGSADLVLEGDNTELVLDRENSFEFKNIVSDQGSVLHRGKGATTFSGANTYLGSTTIENGVLELSNAQGIPQESATLVTGSGRLDLATNLIGRGEFRIDDLSIEEGGQVFVRASQPLVSKNIVLNANAAGEDNPGGITVALKSKDEPPIRVSETFDYQSGSLVVAGPATDDPEGTWKIIDGEVSNVNALARATYLVVSGGNKATYAFGGLGKRYTVMGPALYKGYLDQGSLDLVIEQKTFEELNCGLNPDSKDCEGPQVGNEVPIYLPSPEGPQAGNEVPVYLPSPNEGVGNELPDPDDDGDGELDQLPGCEVGDDLCDIISDSPGDEDDALGQEEELAGDVIDGLLDGLEEDEIDLPLSFDYGQLARLITSGLLPRNVDAPGRSLFNYNNLLVDTVFERLPLRQFKAVAVAEVIENDAVIVEPAPASEPVRGLWSQREGMDEQQAQTFINQQLAQGEPSVVEQSTLMELDGVGYVEDPSLTAQYANREGVRAWYRAFGGDIGPSTTSTLYGNYNASAGGMVLGADVSLGSNVQIGVFGNYGDVNLYQYSGDTGSGSWNPSGWGGGITADWWSDNFYVQGLISASNFSGNQSRSIVAINETLGNQTARADKNVTSYAYALRLGAPFQSGNLLLEPQFTAAWTQNQESGFTENGAGNLNLRYGSRTTNFLQTELGMKLALPIKSGERGEWVPNLRLAWLGDWNQNNESQSIGYAFTDQTVGVSSLEGDQNGLLIEGGLDYTMANINSGSWKLYVRGGAEVWGGERGTDWRTSGGVTFQF